MTLSPAEIREFAIDYDVVERPRRPFSLVEDLMNRAVARAVSDDVDDDVVVLVLDRIWTTVNPIMKEIKP